jgi:hypothetical protein
VRSRRHGSRCQRSAGVSAAPHDGNDSIRRPGRHGKETVPDPEVAVRTLSDGSIHRLVKGYIDPGRLGAMLEAMG